MALAQAPAFLRNFHVTYQMLELDGFKLGQCDIDSLPEILDFMRTRAAGKRAVTKLERLSKEVAVENPGKRTKRKTNLDLPA